MNLRIEKAKSFLKKGDIQVSEVAAKVGYGDPLAFPKIFKARPGRSPREYKDEKRSLVVKGKNGDYTPILWQCSPVICSASPKSVP